MSDRPDPDRRGGPGGDDDEPTWVGALVGVLGALGFNRMRLRWKLRRWVRGRRTVANRRAQAVAHVRYQHRVCPHCTAVNDRGDSECSRCRRPLEARPVELARRVGVPVPRGAVLTTLIGAALVVFASTVLAVSSDGLVQLSPLALARHGGTLAGDGPGLRDLTSLLVHGGVIHVVVALFSMALVVSMVEEDLGAPLIVPLFLISGGLASVLSGVMGRGGVGVGPVGALMGLIGAGAIIGHRAGTPRGRTHRNELLSLAVLVTMLSVFVDTDFRALPAGLVIGAGLGAIAPVAALRARPVVARAVGIAGLAVVVALAVVAAVPLLPDPAPGPAAAEARAGSYLDKYLPWSTDPGDPDDLGTRFAMCEAATRDDRVAIDAMGGPAVVGGACRSLDQLRRDCADVDTALAGIDAPEVASQMRARLIHECRAVRAVDDMRARGK